ncbi:phospholipid phosphatase 5 isoform X2 [Toxorhynchites rutilus septentrionalis]|nr:phospholipid phosphatase 5 isoform X2 [Toxorhynchites rutilus septentrionalis]
MYFEWKDPFIRKIQPDEMWLYRNPRTESYVPLIALYPSMYGFAALVFVTYFFHTRDLTDFKCAWLGISLAGTLNGVITQSIKIAVGRPRPDFFWRCFPDGVMNEDMLCSGDHHSIMEGRKSFPSGHSSVAFASLGFISLYLFGKLNVFNERGRGQAWRLVVSVVPLLAATMVAISRTCDYHHHWQDVVVGSVIGLIEGYLCYRQYFPSLDSRYCYLAYASDAMYPNPSRKTTSKPEASGIEVNPENEMLVDTAEKDNKWT